MEFTVKDLFEHIFAWLEIRVPEAGLAGSNAKKAWELYRGKSWNQALPRAGPQFRDIIKSYCVKGNLWLGIDVCEANLTLQTPHRSSNVSFIWYRDTSSRHPTLLQWEPPFHESSWSFWRSPPSPPYSTMELLLRCGGLAILPGMLKALLVTHIKLQESSQSASLL